MSQVESKFPQRSVQIRGRAITAPTSTQLRELIERGLAPEVDRLRRYPEVIGGIHASYRSQEYDSEYVATLSELMEVYANGLARHISIGGQNEKDTSRYMDLLFDLLSNTAHIELRANDEAYLLDMKSRFNELFPYNAYHQLDYALLQRGFEYIPQRSQPIPDYRKYKSRSARATLKQSLGDHYGHFFERYCETVALYELHWSTLLNVQIINEGAGGDYDVLAIAEPTKDIIYIEAKTGSINTHEFAEFCERFKLLRPSFAVIVLDHSTDVLHGKLPILQAAIKAEFDLDNVPKATALPSLTKKWAYNIRGNIFIISGEDVPKALKHCMRYFDGTVRHPLYALDH